VGRGPERNALGASMKLQALVVFGVALIVGLLLAQGLALRVPGHDDVISFLAATGNQERYEAEAPRGRWTEARAWQGFWGLRSGTSLASIARGLSATDVHPPLYFWLLSGWVRLFGTSLTAGWIPNLVLFVTTVLLVRRVALRLGASEFAGTASALLFGLCTPHLLAASEVRANVMLSVIALVFVDLTTRLVRAPRVPTFVALALAAAAGLLVHYQFVLVIGATGLATAVILALRKEWRGFAGFVSAVVAGGVVFVLCHPTFADSFRHGTPPGAGVSPAALARAVTLPWIAASFWVPVRWITTDAGHFLGAGFGLLLGSMFVAYLFRLLRTDAGDEAIHALTALFGISLLSTLFVFGWMPAHTGRLKYWMAFTPLLAVALARGVPSMGGAGRRARWVRMALASALLWQAGQAVWGTWLTVVRSRVDRGESALSKGATLLLDSTARGVLPRILWSVPPRTLVYAADQAELTTSFPAIPESVRELVYVSDLRYGNTLAGRARVFRDLRAHGFAGVSVPGGVDGGGEIFWLSR